MKSETQSHLLVEMLAGRWTLSLLAALADGGRRYQELHDALGRISYKVLTETLRRARARRSPYPPPRSGRIETATLYELTDLGRSLDGPLAAMSEWADDNWPTVEASRQRSDRLRRQTSP